MLCVFLKKLTNTPSENRTNQNIGIEDKHLSEQQLSRVGATA